MSNPSNLSVLYRSIGEAVRGRRRSMGLTQQNLADMLGISRASLANIEVGRQRLLVHQLCNLAHVLDQDVQVLLPKAPDLAKIKEIDGLNFSANLNLEQRQEIAYLLSSEDTSTDSGGSDEYDQDPEQSGIPSC